MSKIMRNIILWSLLLLVMLSTCTQPTTQSPTTTSPPRATATPRPKGTLVPTWTPTASPTIAPTSPPRPTTTATLTRTPFPTRAPRTPTRTVEATTTLTSTHFVTETMDGTPVLSATATLTPTATPRPPKMLLGAFDDLRARVLIYGLHATENIHTNVSAAYTEAGVEKHLLLAEIPGQACPACSASIGGAVFEKVGNDWKVTVEDKHIITLGTFGRAPKGEFIKLGDDRYGVRFNDPYTETNTIGNRFIIITEDEGHLRVALDVITAVTHYGIDGSAEWYCDSDVAFIIGENEDYDDIKITTYGTKPVDGEIQEFKETTTYTFGRWTYYISDRE